MYQLIIKLIFNARTFWVFIIKLGWHSGDLVTLKKFIFQSFYVTNASQYFTKIKKI